MALAALGSCASSVLFWLTRAHDSAGLLPRVGQNPIRIGSELRQRELHTLVQRRLEHPVAQRGAPSGVLVRVPEPDQEWDDLGAATRTFVEG